MKQLIALLLFTILASFSKSEKTMTDVEKDQMKGKVKRVKQEKYNAFEKGGKMVQGEKVKGDGHNYIKSYNENGYTTEFTDYFPYRGPAEKKVYKYENGRLMEIKSYNPGDTLTCITTFKYDAKGNKIEKPDHFPIEKLTGKESWKYDEKGNCLQYNNYNFNGVVYMKWNYRYDNKGNKTEWSCFNDKGKPDGRYTYVYNEKGQPTEMKKYRADNSLEETHSYSYDEHGNKTSHTVIHSGGSKLEETWQYDDKGNMIEWKQEGGPHRSYGFTYEYDARGNWIKRVQVENDVPEMNLKTKKTEYRNNVPVAVTSRTIEYYE